MFEHFTFGAHAQSSYTPVEDTFPSPTDCSFTLDSPLDVDEEESESEEKEQLNEIVSQLSSHSLHLDDDELPQRSAWNALPAPDFSNETMTDFTPEELSYTSSGRGKVTLPLVVGNPISLPDSSSISMQKTNNGRGTVACRRLQRQLNVQLQSCSTHVKDISTLVEEMISTSSQCVLHPPSSTTTTSSSSSSSSPLLLISTEDDEAEAEDEDLDIPSPLQTQTMHDDEGFAEMDEDDENEMTLRRASTPSGIRKWNVRFRANGECVNGFGSVQDAAWVGKRRKCVPRMRRRRPKVEV